MLKLILKRLLYALPFLALLSIFGFILIHSIPGDPIDILVGQSQKDFSQADLNALKQEMGLNRPLYQQYFSWLSGFWGQGELGRSYTDGRPVLTVIGERLPATLVLVVASLALSFFLGLGWGLLASIFEFAKGFGWLSRTLLTLATIVYAIPGFWLAFFMLVTVAIWFPWLRITGLNDPGQPITFLSLMAHLALPAIALASRRAAKVALFIRSSAKQELAKEYVVTALAKGLSFKETVIRHVLRNSLMPIVSLLGLSLPALLGGSVLIETVFAWPGLGRLAVEATFGRNYPLLMALIVIYGAMVILSNLLADILYGLVDPRIDEDTDGNTSLAGSV